MKGEADSVWHVTQEGLIRGLVSKQCFVHIFPQRGDRNLISGKVQSIWDFNFFISLVGIGFLLVVWLKKKKKTMKLQELLHRRPKESQSTTYRNVGKKKKNVPNRWRPTRWLLVCGKVLCYKYCRIPLSLLKRKIALHFRQQKWLDKPLVHM